MAKSRDGGKFIIFVTLLISNFVYSVVASNSNSVTESCTAIDETAAECGSDNLDDVLLSENLHYLEKLEESVKNLAQVVARLECQFIQCSSKLKTRPLSLAEAEGLAEIKEGEKSGSEIRPALVTTHNAIWSEWFEFVAAVKLRSNPNCINLLPFRDFDGLSKYFAVGDDNGSAYVFFRTGEVALEIVVNSSLNNVSPVTAMVSYLSAYKNDSMIVLGHEDGVIVMHRVWEAMRNKEQISLKVEQVGRFQTLGLEQSSIRMLEVHYVGRRRYILAVNSHGIIIVFKDGTFHGVVSPSSRLIAFLKQRLLFLTETGAGSLDLRTMKLKESECEGFNGSYAVRYVFDATDRMKAYGFNSNGDFIHTRLVGDAVSFKCQVRFKRKLDMDKPLSLHAIIGYLLMSDKDKVYVYNVSTQPYVRAGVVRFLLLATLDEISSSFTNREVVESDVAKPLIVSDYNKDVVVSLGNGYVAMYRSNLPVTKYKFKRIWWTGPVMFFVLFIFVVWHYSANGKGPGTSWGPNVVLTGDRSLTDASRISDGVDVRSTVLGSSSRCSGGAASSYRQGADVALGSNQVRS